MSQEFGSTSADLVRLVAELLDQVSGTAVTECEFRSGSHRVFLRRSPSFVPRASDVTQSDAPEIPAHWIPLTSPLTGIYYAAETPQSPPFVTVGTAIAVGQIIGLIEAMKTFNRVESELSGIVQAVAVTNGAEVQAGQPLLYLESDGEA